MGSGPAGSLGLEIPVISVSALGPLASCPGCRDVPSVAWRPLDCGKGCPPAPCVGLGSGAGSLGRVSMACGFSVADRPLTPGGRRQMTWTIRPPSGEGPLEALLAARARPA